MRSIIVTVLRGTRKTGAVSSAPPKEPKSSVPEWRRVSAPFALAVAAGLFCLAPPLPAQLKPFNEQATGSASHIGVVLRDIDADRASALKLGSVTGAEVIAVENGSPAEQAGIKTGDVLLSYNGENIVGAQQLGRLVAETPVGHKIKIEYFRGGKTNTVPVTTAPWQNVLKFGPDLPGFPNVANSADMWPSYSFPSARFVWTTPRFGIEYEALDSSDWQLAEFFGVKHGVLVRSVAKDSPAAKAGIRAGDVLTQVGEHAVADPRDVSSSIRGEQHQSRPFTVEVMRDHKATTLKVSLGQGAQE